MPSSPRALQQPLPLRFRGGKRRGSGRKPAGARAGSSHARREAFGPREPVHVSVRMLGHVWNLRSQRSYRILDAAIRAARSTLFRVVHFSIQGNHLHLVVEANGPGALASGMRSVSIRIARGLNRMMGRKGPVLAGRYDAHVLRTPAEVRNAVRYVLGNFESHAARRGERTSTKGWIDPFSSAAARPPREAQLALFTQPATSAARGWLLRNAAALVRRRGP